MEHWWSFMLIAGMLLQGVTALAMEPDAAAESAKAIVVSAMPENANSAKAAMVDGDEGTYWKSGNVADFAAAPASVVLDLQSELPVSRMILTPRKFDAGVADTVDSRPLGYRISTAGQASPNEWTVKANGTVVYDDSNADEPKSLAFTETTARYVKLEITSVNKGQSVSIGELSVDNGIGGGESMDGMQFYHLRDGFENSFLKFQEGGSARVAFLGGSITEKGTGGFRVNMQDYLKAKFPQTQFTFIQAGIASTDSTLGAFRLEQKILSGGPVDLLFVEFAVNDPSNGRTAEEQIKGMEGILRHAWNANRMMDIMTMYFQQDTGGINNAAAIETHEQVAGHYQLTSLDFAREVNARVAAGEFTWTDFGGTHPQPMGHKIYSDGMIKVLENSWNQVAPGAAPVPKSLPEEQLRPDSYVGGRYQNITSAELGSGFSLVEKWVPAEGSTRGGFFNVPTLAASKPDAALTVTFTGTDIGILNVAGPDAGKIAYCIDGGPEQTVDLFSPWSRTINLPWPKMLGVNLEPGEHTLELRVLSEKNASSKGTGVYIQQFMVNDPTSFVDLDPSVTNMKITGTPVAGETLTFHYDLWDPSNKEMGLQKKIDWQQQGAPYYVRAGGENMETSLQKGTLTYTIPNDDSLVGAYIAVSLPITGIGSGARNRSIGIGPILPEKPQTPVASSVTIGHPAADHAVGCDIGQTLEGQYLYAGANAEGDSRYQWYAGDPETGVYTAIEGATNRTYVTQADDYKHCLKFTVTPVDAAGTQGVEAAGLSGPRVGDAAYGAFVSGDAACLAGGALNSLTGGLESAAGGGIDTENGDGASSSIVVDLAREQRIGSAAVLAEGTDTDTVTLYGSMDGDAYTPIFTSAYNGTDSAEKILFGDAKNITFKEPVQTRYVKIVFTRGTNVSLHSVSFFTPMEHKPVITLNGGETISVFQGSLFNDPGYSAIDEEDGNLTAQVVVTGTVDTSRLGDYWLTYRVTDSKAQTTEVKRKVSVTDGVQTEGDLLFRKPVSASANSDAAGRLVDGNPNTGWTPGVPGGYAVVDLGESQLISHTVLREQGNVVTSYNIAVSEDQATWQAVHEGKAIGAGKQIDFEPVKGRYVRLTVTGAAAPTINTWELGADAMGKVKAAVAALTLTADLSHVTEDLTLPANGLYGTAVTWRSNEPDVITSGGSVKRKGYDVDLKLIATVALDGAFLDKVFSVHVPKQSQRGGSGGGGGRGGSGSAGGGVVDIPVATPEPSNNTYSDLPAGHWAGGYIAKLTERGVMKGFEDGTFAPDAQITREEFLKIVVEGLGLSAPQNGTNFSDVDQKEWYARYIGIGVALGIINGVSDDTFGVGQMVTREDMAVILERAARQAAITLDTKQEKTFADAGEISAYAADAVEKLSSCGVFDGDSGNCFNPRASATRAEAAKVLCVLLGIA